jgi:uncharacterized protein with LGFP repeats
MTVANNKNRTSNPDASGNKQPSKLALQDLPETSDDLTDEEANEVMGGARYRPQFEALEDRQMMSASPVTNVAPVQANSAELVHVQFTPDPIQAKYASLGGSSSFLGPAIGGEMNTPYGNGQYQLYAGGAIFYSPATGAHWMDPFAEGEWERTALEWDGDGNNVQQDLGLPTADEAPIPNMPGPNQVVNMQGGHIWNQGGASGVGAHVTYGAIDREYVATAQERDGLGVNVQRLIGMPTADETNVAGVPGARVTTFQNGPIYWSARTGAHVMYTAVLDKYDRTGGPTHWGLPTIDENWSLYVPGLRYQEFLSANGYTTGILRTNQGEGTAYVLTANMYKEFLATNNEANAQGRVVQADLGAPTSDTVPVPGVTLAFMNTFQGGAIYFSVATGQAHVVYGGIYAKYISAGGPARYGMPTTEEANSPFVTGSRFQEFQIAGNQFVDSIYWSSAYGAHLMYGAIYQKYVLSPDEGLDHKGQYAPTTLGALTSDEENVPGVAGARMNTFQNGAIYYSSSTGANWVAGDIFAKFQSAGGPAHYGLPQFDEHQYFNTTTRYQEFQVPGGEFVNAIYWSPAHGAHLIHGAIYQEYRATGSNYQGQPFVLVLGALTSDEESVPGVLGARMNTFENGVIYYSGATGAHVVAAGFFTAYQQAGGPTGALGLPTSDEMPKINEAVMNFQHGYIQWDAATGFQTHFYPRPYVHRHKA